MSLVKYSGKQSFYRMMAKATNNYVSEIQVDRKDQLTDMYQRYAMCLKALRLCLADETKGLQNRQQKLTKDFESIAQQQQGQADEQIISSALPQSTAVATNGEIKALHGEDAPVDEAEWTFQLKQATEVDDQTPEAQAKLLGKAAAIKKAKNKRAATTATDSLHRAKRVKQ